jgi:hypothetical protein
MNMNLNTRIEDLEPKEVRRLIRHAKAWCEGHLGISRIKKPLRIRVLNLTDPDDLEDWLTFYYNGWYDNNKHTINININRSRRVKEFLKTLIHEYTHTIQPVRTHYAKASAKLGYFDNPYEVHARANEIYYKHVWESYKAKRK